NKEDLVEPRGALAAKAVRRFAARGVLFEARELDVAGGLLLPETIWTRSAELVGPARARRLPGFAREEDSGGPGGPVHERGRGLLEKDHDRVGVLRLDRLYVRPEHLAEGGDLPPSLQ